MVPLFTVTTVLVTLPTSIVVVYEPLVVPYESLYPAMFGSGFGFHDALTVAACSRPAKLSNNRTKMTKLHGRV